MSEQYSNHRDTPLRRFNTFWWGLAYFGLFGLVSALVYWTTDTPQDVDDMRKSDRMETRRKVDEAQTKLMGEKDMSTMGDKVMMKPKASDVPHPDAGASADSVDPELIAKGKELYPIKGCATCHGPDGTKPTAPIYPSLGGKSSAYLIKQMVDIKSGARKTQLTPVMKPFIDQCSDEDIKAIAAWLSTKK